MVQKKGKREKFIKSYFKNLLIKNKFSFDTSLALLE